jgi:hypothetical protein
VETVCLNWIVDLLGHVLNSGLCIYRVNGVDLKQILNGQYSLP